MASEKFPETTSKEQIRTLRTNLKAMEAELKSARKSLKDKAEEERLLNSKATALESEVEALHKDMGDLESSYKAAIADKESAELEIEELRRQLATANKKIEELESDYEGGRGSSDLPDDTSTLKGLRDFQKHCMRRLSRMSRSHNSTPGQVAAVQAQLDWARSRISEINDWMEDLKDRGEWDYDRNRS